MRCIFLLLLLFVAAMQDASALEYTQFARLPVLHDGRVKPLDTVARLALKRFHGRDSLPDKTAAAWFAEVLFHPEAAMSEPVFVIHGEAAARMLGLKPQAGYSFNELAAALTAHAPQVKALLARDRKTLPAPEQELVRLSVDLNDFAELAGTFSLLLPIPRLDAETRRRWNLPPQDELTYLDLMKLREKLDASVAATVRRKQEKLDTYTPDEQRSAILSYRLSLLEAAGRQNAFLRVIPPTWEGEADWQTPWMVVKSGQGSPRTGAFFRLWKRLASAYDNGDEAGWRMVGGELMDEAAELRPAEVRPWALSLETTYHAAAPLALSLAFYLLGALLALVAMARRTERFGRVAFGVICLGAIVHGTAIAARMLILMRPPVGTLYESMVFVSFVAAVLGLFLERRRKGADGLFLSAAIAAGLLAAGDVFGAGSDTFEVLVAVLNTNFWLATHVLCITSGYGLSLLAGMLAHLYLFRRAFALSSPEALAALARRLHQVALVALLFTATGTMLGGIWADQSWGRFWGWDPKENGALWIVLWLIWLVHGRVGGQVGDRGFAIGTAWITVVVALAWVGVNLLSVGLHSYGFTDTAADGLMAFCAAEAVVINGLALLIWRREKRVYAR